MRPLAQFACLLAFSITFGVNVVQFPDFLIELRIFVVDHHLGETLCRSLALSVLCLLVWCVFSVPSLGASIILVSSG